MKTLFHHICLFALLLLCSHSLLAQISYGGSPLMNTDDFSAEEVIYLLPNEEPLVIEAAKSFKYNQVKKARQYAVERLVDLSPEFNGEWLQLENMRVWRVHIISPQAYSLGVLFSEYEISDGVRIFIYDESGKHIKGAFTSRNNKDFGSLFVSHIPGEQVIIEMQVDNDISEYGGLRIGSLSHSVEPVFSRKNKSVSDLGDSQDCEIDINCEEGDDWQIVKKSVCQIETPRLWCTGVLVNNTSYNGAPYILTAEHCLNQDGYSQNTVFTFGFENSECFGEDATMDNSISGATLLATGDSIDFSILELSEKPPKEYDLYYVGWDLRKTNFNSSVTIHHPNADAMKITIDHDPMETANPDFIPRSLSIDYFVESNFWIKQWDIGTTEGGSSGSPLFNENKRLIGLLSGGLARCGDSIGYDEEANRIIFSNHYNATNEYNEDDYYSRLYYAWDYFKDEKKQLKKWLDPDSTGMLSIGGLSQKTLDVKNDPISDKGLLVYPNPSNGDITITLPESINMNFSVEIYNITGSLIHKELRSTQELLQLNLNHLQSGIFFIKLSGKNFSASTSILIQR